MKSKKELRQEYKVKRCQLAEEVELELNKKLLLQFKEIDLSMVKFMHIFLPIEKYHEPDTYSLINYIRASFPEITIVVSRSNFDDCSMQHFILDEQTRFETNRWGILEPIAGVEISPTAIDLIIVPLLVFDLEGHRVGYGKGFYDRFFSTCKSTVQRVGLSFFDPVAVILDKNEHDIQLTKAITPYNMYSFDVN